MEFSNVCFELIDEIDATDWSAFSPRPIDARVPLIGSRVHNAVK